MTNEEAITVLSVLKNNEGILENEQNVDALIMAISALESHRWIPVTERLPEENKRILFFVKGLNNIYIGIYFDDFFMPMLSSLIFNEKDVTHWMQLPPMPKEEST